MAQSKIQQVFEFGWQNTVPFILRPTSRKRLPCPSFGVRPAHWAALSASVPIADIPNSTTIPAATVTVPAARL